MQHVIYSGTGVYDSHTYVADYRVYLPVLTTGSYEFITNKIFNMSCTQYPNTVLMFMRVANGSNAGFSGCTEEPGIPVTFSISPTSLYDVDPNCIPLDYGKLIYVIIMHDESLTLPVAIEECYCKAPVISTCPKDASEEENETNGDETPGPYTGPFYRKYGKILPHNA